MKYILGIDEAGRGPVLGPMVICGVLLNKEKANFFKDLGIKDSKKLSFKKREYLSKIIIDELISFSIFFSWPDEIDEFVNISSLNILEAKIMSNIINSYSSKRSNLDFEVIIDSPQKKFLDLICLYLQNTKIINNIKCEFKADQNHIQVSVASVLAKYYRDLTIEKLKLIYGDFGSGYPSDKKTQEYLRKFLNKKNNKNNNLNILRKSWNLKISS